MSISQAYCHGHSDQGKSDDLWKKKKNLHIVILLLKVFDASVRYVIKDEFPNEMLSCKSLESTATGICTNIRKFLPVVSVCWWG